MAHMSAISSFSSPLHLSRLNDKGEHQQKKKVDEKTVDEMSALFLSFHLKQIYPKKEENFDSEILQSFWIDALAKEMTKTDPLGIKKMMMKQNEPAQDSPTDSPTKEGYYELYA